jgi:membrane protein implicated in regulation of membrane protease activity
MSFELVAALTGLSILVFSIALFDDEDSRLSSWGVVLGVGLAVAGFVAVLLPDGWVTLLVAAAAGLLVAVAIRWGLGRVAARAARRFAAAAEELRGQLATVTSAIPPDGPGEVSVTLQGSPVQLAAVADQPVARGEQVLIVAVESPTQVRVETAIGST